jgi:hypothetical protein
LSRMPIPLRDGRWRRRQGDLHRALISVVSGGKKCLPVVLPG